MLIGEISAATGMSESTLRYYERKKLIKVARDATGRRNYEEADVKWLRFLQRLKDTGMMLCDIQCYASLRYKGSCTMPERIKMLQKHRKYVLSQQKKWQDYLLNLDRKIAFYKKNINESQT